jgi:hypothetical protein
MNFNINFQEPSIIKLLWTSGWDSTFRLLQLVVEQQAAVQPIYILDIARASTYIEIQKMYEIRNLIYKLFPGTESLILPTYLFTILDIPSNNEITNKFKILKQRSHLGGQYDWLSRFAIQHKINDLELSIHIDDKAHDFIKNAVVRKEKQQKNSFFLDPNIDPKDPLYLFKPFSFPLLEWTKVQMKQHAAKSGTMDIMNHTWFCFKPIKGEPCGMCNPCIYSIEEGMEFRFSKRALLRYKIRPAYRILNKAFRLLRK